MEWSWVPIEFRHRAGTQAMMGWARALASGALVPALRRSFSGPSTPPRRGEHHVIFLLVSSTSSPTRSFCAPPALAEAPGLAEMERPIALTINVMGGPIRIVAAPSLSESEFRNAIDSFLFKQWLTNLQGENGILASGDFTLKEVLIQGVDMFGRGVGFLKFRSEIIDKKTGTKVPGIVFARGRAVAVLILLEAEGDTFVVLTEQVRVPVGKFILELPVGMLDNDKGDVIGTAAREVEEEVGIRLNMDNMIDLTAFLDPSTGCRMFPSPGGCDEELSLFLYRRSVKKEVIEALQGKEMGLREHGELIKVNVVPYKKLWRMTADAKVLASIALYEMAMREGLIPPTKNASESSSW